MIVPTGKEGKAAFLATFLTGVFLLFIQTANGGQAAQRPDMPAGWRVVSDFQVPAEQVKGLSRKLGAEFIGVRNTVYEVNGERVQLNVIVAEDPAEADKLMAKLRSMKAEETLFRKGQIIYEFVGPNEVLPLIAKGREHLRSR